MPERSRGRGWASRRTLWVVIVLVCGFLALVMMGPGRSPAANADLGAAAPADRSSLLTTLRRLVGVRDPLPGNADPTGRGAAAKHRRAAADGDSGDGDSDTRAEDPSASASAGSPTSSGAAVDRSVSKGAPLPGTPPGSPRNARVSGRVVDATGGPVSGARVGAYFEEFWEARMRQRGLRALAGPPDAEWIANDRGEFEGLAPAGGLWLDATAEAYSGARQIARAPASDLVLTLTPGASVRGRVQRVDGTAVPGAAIQVTARGREELPRETRTDERGEFTVAGVPSGVLEVSASALGLSTARESLQLSVAEGSAPLLLTLRPAHSIRGVVHAGDRPCTAGIVTAQGLLARTANLDEHGTYQIHEVGDGKQSFTALCWGMAPQQRSLAFGPDSPAITELDWALDVGFSLTGSLHRPDGTPVAAEAMVPLQVPAPDGLEGAPDTFSMGAVSLGNDCKTDAAGEFECRGLAPGWYRVTTSSSSGVSSEPVRVGAEATPHVDLILPVTGEVRVHVAGGSSRAGIERGVFAHHDLPFPIPARPRGDDYVLPNLPLGRYRITLGRAAREVGPSAVDIELTHAGQVIDIELRAADVASITGIVVDSNGVPVPDAWVKIALRELGMLRSEVEPVLTNSSGSFELADLPSGRYVVIATHSLGEAYQVDIAAGQRGVRLVLEPYGALTGSLTTPDGQPVARFSVILFREVPGEPLQVEGQSGSWSAPWLAPGDYRVIAMAPAGRAESRARVTSGQQLQLPLQLSPQSEGGGIPSAETP